MGHTVVVDDASRRLEIENAVNRCHRRCRIVNVRQKPALLGTGPIINWPFGWPLGKITNIPKGPTADEIRAAVERLRQNNCTIAI